MADPLPHDHIIPFKDSDKTKTQQVADMFDHIAGRYDFMNRFLSAGTDIAWRKKGIHLLKKYRPALLLDVATGTGDMAILANRILQPTKIIGIDISEQMLEVGRKKIEKEGLVDKIELRKGDSETINTAENTFDAVMAAFGVRNFEHLDKGLAEMYRVLKPGGQLMIIEFSKPRHRLIRGLYNMYMGILAPRMARLFRQNKEAYEYLNASSNAFPDRHQFTDILNRIGFSDTRFKSLSLGICCIYTGRKPG